MKKRTIIAVASAAVAAAALSAGTIAATVSTYDPSSDPLVTKSYVESYVNGKILDLSGTSADAVRAEVENQLSEMNIVGYVTEEVKNSISDELYGTFRDDVKSDVLTEVEKMKLDADVAYKLVYLTKGQRLIGVGCTELILRDGDAAAITVDDGLSDVTKGVDLVSGEAIEKNHYLLIPIDDGRGILVTSDEAYVLVRGDYEIR